MGLVALTGVFLVNSGRLYELQRLAQLPCELQLRTGLWHRKAGGTGPPGNSHCSDLIGHWLLCQSRSKRPRLGERSALWGVRPWTCELQPADGRASVASGTQVPALWIESNIEHPGLNDL